jgi:hypothetical protein
VNAQACPSESELLSYADVDLTPEQLGRVERHVAGCTRCAAELAKLKRLIADLGAPISGAALDVKAHVAQVMSRLDKPVPRPARPHLAAWGAGLLAAVVTLALVPRLWEADRDGQWAARGAGEAASLSRDVGIHLYASEERLRDLDDGSALSSTTALTAGLRNVSPAAVHLLLFAVDARSTVHWIAPAFTDPTSDPASIRVAPGATERPLATSVVFDDVASGQLRVVAVISEHPLHVSEVERLKPEDLAGERLSRLFPQASVRVTSLRVTRGDAP